MKRKIVILFAVLFVVLRGGLQGQNREIRFEAGSFQEALDLARQEGKWLFVDCYTSWCGPCKLLARDVFTRDSVADFFNARFINFSVDMEKGEGKALQEKYQVEAYPTLLLLDTAGKEMFRSVGGCSAAELLDRFRMAMNPQNTLPAMAERFAEGEREPGFIRHYWNTLQESHQTEELSRSAQAFFRGMSVAQISREPFWTLFDCYVDIDSPLHHLLVDSVETWKALKGCTKIEEKLGREYDRAIAGRITNVGHTLEQVEQYADDLVKIGFRDSTCLFYLQGYLKIARLKVEKKYDEYLSYLEKEVLTAFSPEERGRALVSLVMLADGTAEQRKKGHELLVQQVKAIMKEKGGLSPYENQIFGYIQFKLSGQQPGKE